jgi:hypothetical protein
MWQCTVNCISNTSGASVCASCAHERAHNAFLLPVSCSPILTVASSWSSRYLPRRQHNTSDEPCRRMKNTEKLAASKKTPLVAEYCYGKIRYVRSEAPP